MYNSDLKTMLSLDQVKYRIIEESLKDLGYDDISNILLNRENEKFNENGEVCAKDEHFEYLHCIVGGIYEDLKEGKHQKVVSLFQESLAAEDTGLRGTEINGTRENRLDKEGLSTILNANVSPGSPEMRGVVLLILYLIRRNYLLEVIIACSLQAEELQNVCLAGDIAKYQKSPVTSAEMMQILRNEMLPLLDSIEELGSYQDFVSAIQSMWPGKENSMDLLTREHESSILLPLVLKSPLRLEELKIALFEKGLLIGNSSSSDDQNMRIFNSLRSNLVDLLLSNVFKADYLQSNSSITRIPPNFLGELIDTYILSKREKVPFYLPSRIDSDAPDYDLLLLPFREINERYKSRFPISLLLTRKCHTDEVWVCKFSPLGKYLVTASKNGELVFYDVFLGFVPLHVQDLEASNESSENNKAITYCCWDPNEKYLITCCFDNIVRVWDVSNLEKMHARKLNDGLDLDISDINISLKSSFTPGENVRTWSCEFLSQPHPKSPIFILGSLDKILKAYDIDGLEIFDFYGDNDDTHYDENDSMQAKRNDSVFDDKNESKDKNTGINKLHNTYNRVHDLAITPDSKFLITVDANKQMHIFTIPDFDNPESTTTEVALINFLEGIASCSISRSGKYLLINMKPGELQVWNISGLRNFEQPILERKLVGHNLGSNVIRPCFGYLSPKGEELVLSGSQDGNIYIWKIETGQPVTRIEGHGGICNAVDWNNGYIQKEGAPDYGQYWCSVGDDCMVNIYGPPE